MPNGRPKAALLILLLALYVLTGSGTLANHTSSSSTTTATTTPTTTTTSNQQPNVTSKTTTGPVLRDLTIGYLTAAKGSLNNRQGLSISGALTLALKEASIPFRLLFPIHYLLAQGSR